MDMAELLPKNFAAFSGRWQDSRTGYTGTRGLRVCSGRLRVGESTYRLCKLQRGHKGDCEAAVSPKKGAS